MLVSTTGVNYSSVYIAPPKDRTQGRSVRSMGDIVSCGKIPYGNPFAPVKLKSFTYKLKTTSPALGGDLSNEFHYHLKDFFGKYGSAVHVIREMGADSVTKILSVEDMESDTSFTQTSIQISQIDAWGDLAAAKPIELVLMGVPSGKVTLDVKVKGTEMTVTLTDITGTLYKVSGEIDKESIDDYGNSNYIGVKADKKHLIIKVDKDHADFKGDGFSLTEEFPTGLLTDSGAVSLANISAQAKSIMESVDYYGSFGQADKAIIKEIRTVAQAKRVPSIIDIVGCNTVDDVAAYIGLLGFSEYDVVFLWNREIYGFPTSSLNIGLSGWYLGNRVAKNQASKKGVVEDRVNGIGYLNYPIIRSVATKSSILSDDDLERLVALRVNTTGNVRGTTILTDILAGERKNTFLKNAAVANGEMFLARAIARLIEDEFGQNINIAKERLQTFIRILFENAEGMNYFDMDAPLQWQFQLTDKEGDTIICTYCYYPTGAVRKGIVEPMLCAVEAKI
jgi:hypothetical protein